MIETRYFIVIGKEADKFIAIIYSDIHEVKSLENKQISMLLRDIGLNIGENERKEKMETLGMIYRMVTRDFA